MKPLIGAVLLVFVGLGIFEIAMQPTVTERTGVALLFGLMAGVTSMVAVMLPRLADGQLSLRVTVLALSLVALIVVAVGLLAAGQAMFLSDHDLGLLTVLVGFGVGVGILFAVSVTRPLTEDLTRISDTATSIADGDLRARTGVVRSDEIGSLASSVDAMAVKLASADSARSEFLAAVGHDLRTPLASLRLAVEAMQDGIAIDRRRYLEAMSSDVEALSRLVDDLYLLARIDAGEFEPGPDVVDLAEIADEAIEVFRPIARQRDIDLRLLTDQNVVVAAGPDAMSRVLRNLVDNAVRHSPAGGEVVLVVSNGRAAQVRVTDDGEGFSPEFAPVAFERFSRDDRARSRVTGGTGLGLAIAHGFVTHAGGTIWAEPGPGGKVAFTLPI